MQRNAAALVLMVATALAVPVTTAAQEGDGGAAKRLKQVESEISKGKARAQQLTSQAQALAADTAKLRQQMIASARRIQSREQRVQDLAAKVEKLNALEKKKSVELESRRKQFAEVLMALQRIAAFPPEALIARPMSPADTVRSAILLKSTVPEIEHRAVQLRQEIDFIAQTRNEAAQQQAELDAERKSLKAERHQMQILLARKEVLRRHMLARSRVEETRVEALAKEASSLRDLLARLDAQRKQEQERRRREARAASQLPENAPTQKARENGLTQTARAEPAAPGDQKPANFPTAPISQARGHLTVPVVGRLIGTFGEKMRSGLTRQGLDFETPPDAQVVAPYAGKVVYAGKFRGYGHLLIIEHAGGYHSLMAGMKRIDAAIGQWVLAGEPVGVMAGASGKNPILYLELRRDGQPVNPLPWLASRKDKANG